MDFDNQTTFLSDKGTSKPLERESRSQNCSRWYRVRTVGRSKAFTAVPSSWASFADSTCWAVIICLSLTVFDNVHCSSFFQRKTSWFIVCIWRCLVSCVYGPYSLIESTFSQKLHGKRSSSGHESSRNLQHTHIVLGQTHEAKYLRYTEHDFFFSSLP